eukprot:257983-Pelagomonas_calceolata.AAC.1
MCASQIWVTFFLQQGHEMDNGIQKWLLRFLNIHSGSQISNSFMECAMRMWDRCQAEKHTLVAADSRHDTEPVQFNWFRATVRLNKSRINCNSPLLQKVFHADIDVNFRNPSCWTLHPLAVNGLHHARGFQH